MSIRPVDLQVMMPRAAESSKTASNENVRPVVENQQFANQMQRNVYNEQRSVIQSNKTEDSAVDKDGKGNNGSDRQDSRRNRKGKRPGEQAQTSEHQSLLDIRL